MSADTDIKISGKMGTFVAGLTYDDLPDDVRNQAKLCLLDTLGCALAGATTDESILVRRAMADAAGTSGDSVLWGTTDTAPLPFAVLANGVAVHAREIDDFGGCAHSGSVVIPAALSAGARMRVSGRDLLAAIVAGYDIAHRVMDGGGGYLAFKARGWHSTATCGGFGAAAAVASVMKLDPQRTQWALGYAGSNAGSTWAFIPEGAMSKRVHPGLAGQTGIISAYLAAHRVSAPESIFEAEWGGYYPTYVGELASPERATAGLGEDFRIRLVGFKPYAACRGIHSSLEVILGLRRTRGLVADDVRRVTIRGSATHYKQLRKQKVQTTLDAQMSLPYSIAVALQTGGAMFDQFTPDALHRPEITALAGRVEVVREASVEDGAEPFVDIELNDGSVLTDRVTIPRGECTNPLSEDELCAKFRSTAKLVLNSRQIEELEKAIFAIETLADVSEISNALVPDHRGAEPMKKRVGT